jgi:hypothetical protein
MHLQPPFGRGEQGHYCADLLGARGRQLPPPARHDQATTDFALPVNGTMAKVFGLDDFPQASTVQTAG